MQLKLNISGPYESKTVSVDDELSIGRTELADIVLDDSGLSRKNTTFFIDDGELLVADENSTNGTFVNGTRISRPQIVRSGDVIKIGTDTTITVGDSGESATNVAHVEPVHEYSPVIARDNEPTPSSTINLSIPQDDDEEGPDHTKVLLFAAGSLAILIVFLTGLGLYIVSGDDNTNGGPVSPPIASGNPIPVRVIDPLGGEDDTDINDIISQWEVAEDELVASDVADINISSPEAEEAELNVSAAFLAERQRLAMENRPGEKGIRPAGLAVPKELFGDGVIKQTRKLREMRATGYQQPMDFADLAEKRMSRDLVEMPMAGESFYLDVGGSAQDSQFLSFEFASPNDIRTPIVQGHPKFDKLKRLADNFAGQKYDLENASDRKQMRRRLLRMFHPRAKPILKKLADGYYAKFRRPLRVTSLTRSMDYQILLNSNNANSYKVRGAGSLPPHTSGCAFDLARKHMPVEEQNYLMQLLAEMERNNELDALIEYGLNACFHIFIYPDGQPPKAFIEDMYKFDQFEFLTRSHHHDH